MSWYFPITTATLHYITTTTLHYTTLHYQILLHYSNYTILTSKDQWHLATGPVAAAAAAAPVAAPAAAATAADAPAAAAVTILAAAAAAPAAAVTVTAATAFVVVIVVAVLAVAATVRVLILGVLRLIRALEPEALDGPDVCPDLRREPLGVVWVVRRLTEGDGSRRPLRLRGELLLWVLRVTKILRWRSWLTFALVVLAHGGSERERRKASNREQQEVWKSRRDNNIIYRRRRQPLTSNRGHWTVAKHSISTSTRLKTRQAADAVSRNTTPIGTPVNSAEHMITPAVTSHYYSEAVG
jgi:hypothetical protein